MDRHEAVLRELNMYPQWVRREVVVVNSAHNINGLNTPFPLVVTNDFADVVGQPSQMASSSIREGRGEGGAENSTLSLALPPQGGGDELVAASKIKITDKQFQVNLNWPELKSTVHSCQACKLRAGCTQTVFGVGDENADWLFVGEGPGADEDAQGEPFVGQAGKLLDNMLMAIKLKRGSNVYITNVVKCRPPEDESGKQLPPKHDEIAQCLPYLKRQIELIQPKVIVALGKIASNALLGKEATLASLRGAPHDYHGIPLIVTYHPAYLLRSPSEKAKTWQDLCMAVELMQKQG